MLKYHCTELGRKVANDAMDVHGGKGNLVRLIGWYDNEWGYANRLAELLELCAIRSVVA